jgi:uncharacterized protein YycO
MKLIKSPIFATIVNIISLLSTLSCLIFVSAYIAAILFIVSVVLFLTFLIINLYLRNWKYVLINFVILGASIFAIAEYLDWATLRMYNGDRVTLKNGDIIFQTSNSSQSKAIQAATNSKYSHMGIIYTEGAEYFVFEASSIVKLTPLNDWINNGLDGKYVVKRIKDAEKILNQDALKEMKMVGEQFKGKKYDRYFGWSNEKIYCSELVWKIYKQALNIEIGKLEKLSDFDLTTKEVQNQLNERYKGKIPYDELVISPAEMFNSEKLITVEEK